MEILDPRDSSRRADCPSVPFPGDSDGREGNLPFPLSTAWGKRDPFLTAEPSSLPGMDGEILPL